MIGLPVKDPGVVRRSQKIDSVSRTGVGSTTDPLSASHKCTPQIGSRLSDETEREHSPAIEQRTMVGQHVVRGESGSLASEMDHVTERRLQIEAEQPRFNRSRVGSEIARFPAHSDTPAMLAPLPCWVAGWRSSHFAANADEPVIDAMADRTLPRGAIRCPGWPR